MTGRDVARQLRREVEQRLDVAGWPWSATVSLWIDTVVIVEEGSPAMFAPGSSR